MSDGNGKGHAVDEAAERDAARMATVDARHICTRCMGPIGSKCYLRTCDRVEFGAADPRYSTDMWQSAKANLDAFVDANRPAVCGHLAQRWGMHVIEGPELAAYQLFQAAAREAQQVQSAMATSGQALRDAFQGLCAVLAPGAK